MFITNTFKLIKLTSDNILCIVGASCLESTVETV